MLADWLVTLSPYISEVVFHPKLIPWFVSDVQPHDFKITLSSLLDPEFFPESANASADDRAALKEMVERWQSYVKSGKFRLSVPLDLKMGEKGGELADCECGNISALHQSHCCSADMTCSVSSLDYAAPVLLHAGESA